MKRIKTIAAAAILSIGLGACTFNGSLNDEIAAVSKVTMEDLDVALKDAKIHDDLAATVCYTRLKEVVVELNRRVQVDPVGPISAFQKARNVRRKLAQGISEKTRVACAALASDTRLTLFRILRRVGVGL